MILPNAIRDPAKRHRTVEYVRNALGRDRVSERRACRVLGQPRSTQRRKPYVPDDEPRLVNQMVELATLRGARIIGPNCLGVLSPDEAKLGGLGGPAVNVRRAFTKGPVGVMSRSGGMTTEICNTLTAAGLGQSTCVSIGGDAIVGTTYAELMPLFEADPETEAIAIYSEPGGRMEAELAEWVKANDSRLPIVAFMAGRFMDEMKGMRFGHAGTIVEGKEDTTSEKIARMEAAGISVAERIEEIPDLIRQRLAEAR